MALVAFLYPPSLEFSWVCIRVAIVQEYQCGWKDRKRARDLDKWTASVLAVTNGALPSMADRRNRPFVHHSPRHSLLHADFMFHGSEQRFRYIHGHFFHLISLCGFITALVSHFQSLDYHHFSGILATISQYSFPHPLFCSLTLHLRHLHIPFRQTSKGPGSMLCFGITCHIISVISFTVSTCIRYCLLFLFMLLSLLSYS